MQAEILNASAGSGKTYRLAYHYVRDVVWKPVLYRHILAVTFTNKATEEMKSRILSEIHRLAIGKESSYLPDLQRDLGLREEVIRRRAQEAQRAILHDYSRFTVLTIDKFFQRILHAFVKELGIDLNFEIELESTPVLHRGVDALIERLGEDPHLKAWLEAFARERLEEHKGWDLRESIRQLGKELFNEGSRERLKQARPREQLAEVVEKAWKQLLETQAQFRKMGGDAVTFIDSLGLTLHDFSNRDKGGAAYFYKVANGEIEPPGKRALACASSCEGWFAKSHKKRPSDSIIEILRQQMEDLCNWYSTHREMWTTIRLIKEHFRTYALLNDLYNEIQRLWREENKLLLSETKNILSVFIDRNDAPFIYEKVGNRFDRYLIDEFQDTSEREWLNFKPLLKDALSHATQLTLPEEEEPGSTVLLVGDTKQSIYRWRGGDWRILGILAPETLGVQTVESMTNNFRSLAEIVYFNNAIIGQVVRLGNQRIEEKIEEGMLSEPGKRQLLEILPGAYTHHVQQVRKKSLHNGYVSVETCGKNPPVVARIQTILDLGYRPSDILILVRKSADGSKVARELLDFKRQNRDPRYYFDVMTQDALNLNASPLCGFIIALLNLCIHPDDKINLAICNRYLGRAVDAVWSDEERQRLAALRLLPTEMAFEEIILQYNLHLDTHQIAYLQALHEAVIHFSSGRVTDISLFLAWWEEHHEKCALQVGKSDTAIEISTIHKAKGLERKVVIIPFCDWELDAGASGFKQTILWAEAGGNFASLGPLPLKYNASMAQSLFSKEYFRELTYSHVDSINLLYVALTRAAEQLHLFISDLSSHRIGQLIWEGIAHKGDEAHIPLWEDGCCQRICIGRAQPIGEEFMRYEFGTMEGPSMSEKRESEHTPQPLTLRHYPTLRPSPTLRLPTAKYQDHGGTTEFSPRNFGILMHRLFEEASTRTMLDRALQRLQDEALITTEEATLLHERVKAVLQDPVVASWYDQEWDYILSERDIIHPTQGALAVEVRRPDRVMIRGDRAVVVDYKFGEQDPATNRKQLRRYMELLHRMGYRQVEGWLWYVRLGRTEAVTMEE